MTINSNNRSTSSTSTKDNDAATNSRCESSGAVNKGKEPEGAINLKKNGNYFFRALEDAGFAQEDLRTISLKKIATKFTDEEDAASQLCMVMVLQPRLVMLHLAMVLWLCLAIQPPPTIITTSAMAKLAPLLLG